MLSVFERCELALGYANSQERGRVLARLPLDELTDSELRGLLALWWPACDAVGRGDAVAIYRMFERVGHVVDCEIGRVPTFPRTVYRAYRADTDPFDGISWTLELDVALFFAGYLKSDRAKFLGIVADGPVRIAQARCGQALAFFEGREESEVIPVMGSLELVRTWEVD